ncbi:MAG TPA: nucleoside-diphosphate sugar epimerase/dehydratase [Acidobacteriota bacterium]|nr:nucleoside-diphosphate sugar epimerase/dehydratase [Acidobacteriota bacterium]
MRNWQKTSVLLTYDLVMAGAAYAAAFLLRFSFDLAPGYFDTLIFTIPLVVTVQVAIFALSGLYRRIWRYAGIRDLFAIIRAVTFGIAASAGVLFLINRLENVPRSVFLIEWFVLLILIGGGRILYRALREGLLLPTSYGAPTLIVGAGAGGTLLLRWIQANPRGGIKVIGLVDDDPAKMGIRLMGHRILGNIDQLAALSNRLGIERILIAIPSGSGRTVRRILEQCEQTEAQVHTIPSLGEMLSGSFEVLELRPIELEDLLGRTQVEIDSKPISEMIGGRRVLVTGAGGSIGSELCRQLAHFEPAEVILVDQSEFFLYKIDLELKESFPELIFSPELADITDSPRIISLVRDQRPDIILHAAAYKHVPILEDNKREAFLNNVGGTLKIAQAAIDNGISKFVMISTDKAVHPASILGATKCAAEMICRALQRDQQATEFITVRFGNVLGSTGSVIPRFEEQIKRGGPVTVTHPDITRYFMSVSEASRLVLLASANGKAGEIYVLDMGEPINICELARALIRINGKIPGRDIKIEFTGLRPGEKMSEELFSKEEKTLPTNHAKIFRAQSDEPPADIIDRVNELLSFAEVGQLEIVKELRLLVPDFIQGRNNEPSD